MLLMSQASVAFASEKPNITSETKDKVNALKQTYGFETTNLYDKNSVLKFDSVDDFEKFLKDFKNQNKEYNIDIKTSKKSNNLQNASLTNSSIVITSDDDDVYSDSELHTWWSPFSGWGMTGVACWKNVGYDYTYKFVNSKAQFVELSNIDSYLSGINITDWEQTSGTYNISTSTNTRDKATTKVRGKYILGIQIQGYTIGAVLSDTWTVSLKLT